MSRALLAVLLLSAPAAAQILTVSERPGPKPPAHSPANQVDEKAANVLALAFEEAVRFQDNESAESLFDVDALLVRAVIGVPASASVRKTFDAGAREGLFGAGGILRGIQRARRAGGTFRFLRLVEREGERATLFRLAHADGSAPEYVELVLAARGKGGVCAVDVWTSREEVLHSRVLRRWLLALVADAGRKLPARISGEDRFFAESGATFERIETLFESGRNEEALATWKELPLEVRIDPAVQLERLRAALAAGQRAFDSALREARTDGQRGAGIELLALDAALVWNRPADSLAAIAAVERAVRGDPYLQGLRGSVLRSMNRFAEAKNACRAAIELDPTLEDAHWTLLAILVVEQRWEETSALLLAMDERFEIDWKGLRGSQAYAAFLESDAGARWRAHGMRR